MVWLPICGGVGRAGDEGWFRADGGTGGSETGAVPHAVTHRLWPSGCACAIDGRLAVMRVVATTARADRLR